MKCSKDGCGNETTPRTDLCMTHYKQAWYLKKVGRTELLPPRTSQGYWINMMSGHVMVKVDGRLTYEHIVLAEKALGKKLPPGAIVQTNSRGIITPHSILLSAPIRNIIAFYIGA